MKGSGKNVFMKGSVPKRKYIGNGCVHERTCSGKEIDRKGCVQERKWTGKDVFMKGSI